MNIGGGLELLASLLAPSTGMYELLLDEVANTFRRVHNRHMKRFEPAVVEALEVRRSFRLVGYLQHRRPVKVERFGGETFASWVRREVDGLETGAPEMFATYPKENMARAHVKYALRKLKREV